MDDLRRAGLFGTGVMARGIAALCLEGGLSLVVLSAAVDRAEAMRSSLREEFPGADVTTDEGGLARCDLLLEATVEELGPKREALRRVEPLLSPDALIASTTSSLSITALAAALERPGRMIGLHFFNPVNRMSLVEVIPGERTEPEAVARGKAVAHALGKRPIAFPDRAGFLVNRLLIPYLNQAVRLVESGMATVEDVDRAMVIGAGHPMGPFKLIDLIGADVCVAIGRSLEDELRRSCDTPPADLVRRAGLGLLGRKAGRGYYEYPKRPEG